MSDMIQIKGLNKYFGDLHVLKDVNLNVKAGEKLVVIGPSGSGKSTLIRCVDFLEEPTSGEVIIDGTPLTKKNHLEMARKYSSMVFQQFNLYPNMTVLGNLTLAPIKLQKKSKEEANKIAMAALERVGLAAKAGEYPQNLSGGQQQRVAIARALCTKQPIILFDEPTSALDPEMVQEVLDVMVELAHENITMICVTHEMGFARQVADRVVFMDDGQILEEGTPDHFFENPENPRCREFLDKILHEFVFACGIAAASRYAEYGFGAMAACAAMNCVSQGRGTNNGYVSSSVFEGSRFGRFERCQHGCACWLRFW